MRDYAKIDSKFWMRGTGKALRGDLEAQLIALYLMSSPHANMIGVYYLPVALLAAETGIPFEGASKGLRRLSEEGLVEVDEETDHVFVVNMARHQVGESLSAKDNRRSAVVRLLRELGDNPLVARFLLKYREIYALEAEFPAPQTETKTEGASKGLRRGSARGFEAREQRTENREQRTEGEKDRIVEPTETAGPSPVREVFDTWRSELGHPNAKLDGKRRRAIQARLDDGYTAAELCEAVRGCARSEWHRGQNDRRQVYDDIELICRSATHVDRFRALASGVRYGTEPSPHSDFENAPDLEVQMAAWGGEHAAA